MLLFVLFLLSAAAVVADHGGGHGCADVLFRVTMRQYASEAAWKVDDSATRGQNYRNNQVYEETICLEAGEHAVTLFDSMNDGWHGGTLEVVGYVEPFTMNNGMRSAERTFVVVVEEEGAHTSDGGCSDLSNGLMNTCAEYESNNWCDLYGSDPSFADANGVTADQACCACGGGFTALPECLPSVSAPAPCDSTDCGARPEIASHCAKCQQCRDPVVEGSDGSADCPPGARPLSEAECTAAAAEDNSLTTNDPFVVYTGFDPKGCFRSASGLSFNTIEGGNGRSGRSVLCRPSGFDPPVSTTPPSPPQPETPQPETPPPPPSETPPSPPPPETDTRPPQSEPESPLTKAASSTTLPGLPFYELTRTKKVMIETMIKNQLGATSVTATYRSHSRRRRGRRLDHGGEAHRGDTIVDWTASFPTAALATSAREGSVETFEAGLTQRLHADPMFEDVSVIATTFTIPEEEDEPEEETRVETEAPRVVTLPPQEEGEGRGYAAAEEEGSMTQSFVSFAVVLAICCAPPILFCGVMAKRITKELGKGGPDNEAAVEDFDPEEGETGRAHSLEDSEPTNTGRYDSGEEDAADGDAEAGETQDLEQDVAGSGDDGEDAGGDDA